MYIRAGARHQPGGGATSVGYPSGSRYVAASRGRALRWANRRRLPGAEMPPPTMGEIENNVYFMMTALYTYVHTVNPSLKNNFLLNTAVRSGGLHGGLWLELLGRDRRRWDRHAGDFVVLRPGQLTWFSHPGSWLGCERADPFFFVSTRPPTIGDYNLIGSESGTANSYAPVPEPGSIALLGSGLVGLYTAMRRRRSLNA